jgi:hypothetical protein
MILKRPSFRRGGNAGIGSITPRVNAKLGFGFLKKGIGGDKMFPQKIGASSSIGTGVEGIISQGMFNELFDKRIPRPPVVGSPLYGALGFAAPVAAVGGLAYLNRPRTLAAKKFMQEFGPLDETMSSDDLKSYYEEVDRLNKVGDQITFSDAIFMDPDTGTYPKMFGRTEDRDTRRKLELEEKEAATAFDDDLESIDEGGESLPATGDLNIIDKVLAEANTRAQDRSDREKRNADTKAKAAAEKDIVKEDSFESVYDKEFKKIKNLIGKSDETTRGEIALALSDAVGTEGTLADKAASLNKFLLGKIAKDKKADRDIAMLAYATVSDLRKAEIAAGKKGPTGQLIERVTELESKGKLTEKEQIELRISKAALSADKPLDFKKIKPVTDNIIKNISRFKEETVPAEQENLKNKILTDVELLRRGNVSDSIILLAFGSDLSLFPELTRVQRSLGSPRGGETEETIKESITMTDDAPAAPVKKLTYEELRDRLPREITNDVVALIANSEQALQDFAYIRTQGDVDSFNVKYGINLVMPQTV